MRSVPTSSSPRSRRADDVATPSSAHVATLIPDEWLAPMATGSPSVRRGGEGQLDIGCDGVIIHGVSPSRPLGDQAY